MKKFGFLGLIGFFAASHCNAVVSEDSDSKKIHYDLTVYNGYITGNSKYIVYRPTYVSGDSEFTVGDSAELVMSDSDDRLSALDWKLQNLLVNGITASARVGKLHLMINGWYQVLSSKTIMVDRDWEDWDKPTQMTHISWSPTKLKNAYEVCAEVGYDLHRWQFKKYDLILQALAGYKHLNLSWEASGGTYHYYDQWGALPDGLGIGYSQKFAIPYLGMRVDCHWKKINYGLFWKVSPGLSKIIAHDYHALRSIDFYDTFKNGDYLMIGGNFALNFSSNLTLNFSYAFDQLQTTRGNTLINDLEDGEVTYFAGGAGVYHAHQICTAEVTFSF